MHVHDAFTTHTKFHQNRPGFVEDMTTIVFFGSQCIHEIRSVFLSFSLRGTVALLAGPAQ